MELDLRPVRVAVGAEMRRACARYVPASPETTARRAASVPASLMAVNRFDSMRCSRGADGPQIQVGDVRIPKDPTPRAGSRQGTQPCRRDADRVPAQGEDRRSGRRGFIGPFQPGADERHTATLVENLERLRLYYETLDSGPGCRPLELGQTLLREERQRHARVARPRGNALKRFREQPLSSELRTSNC